MAEDPIRFLDENESEFMRSLLSAAREEQPEHRALERTLTVVGVGTALAAVGGKSAAAGLAGGAAAQGLTTAASVSSAQGVVSAPLLMVVKWLGAGLVVGLAGTSAVYVATQPNVVVQAPTISKVAPVQAPAPHSTARSTSASTTEVTAPKVVEPIPPPGHAALAVSAAPALVGAIPRVDPDAQLAAEVAVLDRARQALAAGDAPSAVRLLNEYDARFAHPTLLPEALYLRLEALSAQGDQPGTQAVAKRLLRASPEGPHAARARAVLEK